MTDKTLNLIETIAGNDKLSTFSRLMGTSHANEIFSGDGPFTVFAPTNDAFGKMPDNQMNSLLQEKDQFRLKKLLAHHIVSGRFPIDKISSMMRAPSVSGDELKFTDSHGLRVNGCGIQARNIEAADGVVHTLDTVLAAPTALPAE